MPVYALQEPFRWIVDVAVMDAFESGVLDRLDFYFTGDDYRYRFEPEAKERFLNLLRERFNSRVEYKGRAFKWDTVVEQKTAELGRYLVGRTGRLDFLEPFPLYTEWTTVSFGEESSDSHSRSLRGLESERAHCIICVGVPDITDASKQTEISWRR